MFRVVLIVLVATMGCQTGPLTLSESIELIELVRHDPILAGRKCSTLPNADLQNQCWRVTPIPNTKEDQVIRCSNFTGSFKDECYFTMAETHNDAQLCHRSGPFTVDCTTHILQQNCGQYQSASSLLKYAKALHMDIQQQSVAGLLHRCLLDHKPNIDIRKCTNLPHSDRCRTLAITLYTQQLTSMSIDCSKPNIHLNTFNDPDLQAVTTKHINDYCSVQD